MSEETKKKKSKKHAKRQNEEETQNEQRNLSKRHKSDNFQKQVKFNDVPDIKLIKSSSKTNKNQDTDLLPLSEDLEEEINRPENIKNISSKRQRKREKYEKLKTENKLKSETQTQQKALNYLSLWKHNKQEWRFEKLRQMWIQNNMFDEVKIPDEFWETTVKYFGGSQGRIRHVLIEKCMKIMEEEEKINEEDKDDETNNTKFKRARELLQHLQE